MRQTALLAAMLLLLAAIAKPAWSFGFAQLGANFGQLGATMAGPSSAGPGCAASGLKFNVACNSQYTTVIHF